MRDAVVFETEDAVIVAVMLRPMFSMDERTKALSDYAENCARNFGKKTIVTYDLSVYMQLCRMQKRGFDRDDVVLLQSKLSDIEKYCYTS